MTTTAHVSYGSRFGDSDARPGVPGGVRQIARPPCTSLQELIDAIKEDIKGGEESVVPDCTTSQLSLGWQSILELHRPNIGPYAEGGEHDLPERFKTDWTSNPEGVRGRTYPTASVGDITSWSDKAARAVVERAASRGIVAAIELADGFKYSINNAWAGKDEDGQRFSYICQDSMQNKDRHANGFTRTQKHLKGEGERGPRKPTYDCKGSISIKCSKVRNAIDVFYRHYAIHSSVAERKAFPTARAYRPRKSTGRTSSDGDGLDAGEDEVQGADGAVPASQGGSNIGRPLKRKRNEDTPAKAGKALSLVDLLKQSQASEKEKDKTKTSAKPTPKQSPMHPPPMNYDLPSWQTPPAPPPAAKIPRAPAPVTSVGTPYPPPYQPQTGHQIAPRPPSSEQYQPLRHVQPQPVRTPSTSQRKPTTTYNESNLPPEYFGQPAAASTQQSTQGNSQALFSTLKPVRVESPLTLYTARTRSSCTNCRYSKKKCDETRPVCSTCAGAGKFDCAYDGAYGYPASAMQQSQMSGWTVAPQTPQANMMGKWQPGGYAQANGVGQQQQQRQQQQQYQGFVPQQPAPAPTVSAGGTIEQYSQSGAQQGQRQESPDPWFPKR